MTSVLVLGRDWELDRKRRIWGTGGWRSPEEREALDWLTLVRLLGWRAVTATAPAATRPDLCLVAGDFAERPSAGDTLLGWARAGSTIVVPYREAPATLVAGLGASGGTSGRTIRWTGPGPATSWTSGGPVGHLALVPGAGWDVLAEIDGRPAAVVRRDGPGTVVVLGFQPSAARDESGCATALLIRLLTRTVPAPAAWLDLARTMILRMDDPGSAQSVYSRDWCHPKLTSAQWGEVGRVLARRRARMSVAYSPGFVDDGDPARGSLFVDGKEVERIPGAVHPSPLVRYVDAAGHSPGTVHDCRDEYEGLSALVSAGAAGVELHGYTHVHPDRAAWAAAPDRYDNVDWYRELGPRASAALARLEREDHPLTLGPAALERWFGRRPTTLVCPGEEWTDEALEVALDAGLSLVGSYYLALRDGKRLCWTTHVCSPYLDEPAPHWFESGLPVVGYMHDRDLAVNGVGWLDEWMGAWEAEGAERFGDYAWLAALLAHPVEVTHDGGVWSVEVASAGLPPGPAVRVGVRTGARGGVALVDGAGRGPLVGTSGDVETLELRVSRA